jgi:apolipoprotein N-acyltransferase
VDQVALERRMPEAVRFRGVRFGGLMCSDMLSPFLYRHLAREERADVLVNLSNQFWFHGSRHLHHKSLQMARVHAVRNRLPLLVANNMASSYAFDANGRLLAESAWGESGVMVVEVPVSPPPADNVQHSTANAQHSILNER